MPLWCAVAKEVIFCRDKVEILSESQIRFFENFAPGTVVEGFKEL